MLRHSGFTSRARLVHLPPHNPSDLYLGFVPAGLRQVVGHLQPQPGFRAATKGFVETDRHLRRNTGLAVHQIVERLPCQANTPSQPRQFAVSSALRLPG